MGDSDSVLEPAAAAFAEATANPPYLFGLPPAEGRKAVDEVQSGEIEKPQIDEEWITVSGGPTGSVRARIVKPVRAEGILPVILYIHGAGWVFGNAHTHDRRVRELAVGAGAAVVFPEYDLSPDARYPVAIEQNYAVVRWIVEQGATKGLDGTRPAVAADSVGGNTSEADVLRDEGEAYANKLREVGVPVTAVRFQGIIHDFVMLNALRETHAAEAAITLATGTLRIALHAG
jgi:acetyl esterase